MAEAKPKPTPPKPAFSGPLDALGRYLNARSPLASTEKAGFGEAEDKLGKDQTPPPPPPTDLPNDWYKAFFGNYGLPADVQGNILDILKKYASDPGTAQALSTQYLRTTPWFQTTFPGFANGVNNGLFSDETGYRNYLNAYNNVYNQYLGRHISSDETAALLKEGASPDTLGRRFAGQAYINANKDDIQYLSGAFGEGQLAPNQLTALGNETSGIDTQLGQIQQKIMQHAQKIHDKLFQGSLATPNFSLGANGLSAPSLGGTRSTTDVAA